MCSVLRLAVVAVAEGRQGLQGCSGYWEAISYFSLVPKVGLSARPFLLWKLRFAARKQAEASQSEVWCLHNWADDFEGLD
jgi:hypothetical protein